MQTKNILLAGLCALTLVGFTACETIEITNNGPGYGSYDFRGPARVTELSNGKYLVTVGSKIASFNRYGELISGAGLTSSELAHAEMALRYYRNGHRGDYYHPTYAPPSYRPPVWNPAGPVFERPQPSFGGVPEVRPRGDGMLEVLVPGGGVVLYDQRGRMMQKGNSVTGMQLQQANQAVGAYLREQTSSRGYGGV